MVKFEGDVVIVTSEGEMDFNGVSREGYQEVFVDHLQINQQLETVLDKIQNSEGKLIVHVNNDVTMSHLNNVWVLSNNNDTLLSKELGYRG